MKRTALLATLAIVAVSPAIASAAPAGARTVTYAYSGAYGVSTPVVSGALKCQSGMTACWDFATVKGEKTVTISAKDSTGTPIGLQIFTGDDYAGTVQTVCGTGTVTVSPKAANTVSVRPAYAATCPALPTNGTLTAVITKK